MVDWLLVFLLGAFALAVLAVPIPARWRKPTQPSFRYVYQRHPFDNPQYFSVQAENQAAADELAQKKFEEIRAKGGTVMIEFHSLKAKA